MTQGRFFVQRARPKTLFVKYAGALPTFSSTREVNAWVRKLRDDEKSDIR
jgi:hypothetical protein